VVGGENLIWTAAEVPEGLALAILDHIAHPVFVKDRQFRWVVFNRAAAEMCGWPREQMLGKTDFDFFPAPQAEFFRKIDEQMFQSGQMVHVPEELLTDSRGVTHVLSTTKVPLKDAAGTVTHLVGIIQDITRQKLAQDSLKSANEELEQRVQERTRQLELARDELLRKERLAVLGRVAGGLAHQIRNPLGAVLNAAALLKRYLRDVPTPAAHQALQMLEEEAWAANRIISDLVDFARVRRGQPADVTVAQLVEQALASYPCPTNITVERRLGPASVRVDALQVTSALSNLIRNAVEAMPSGGALRIESSEDGSFEVIAVEDSGPGFESGIELQLFEPLVTTKPLGLGLGLTTARMMIEGQGGRLDIAQARPHARVEVRLPRV
jgi:PAS domain S-box-containing protein